MQHVSIAIASVVLIATGWIDSHPLPFFTPPHNEPDLPWVDFYYLLHAFMPWADAPHQVHHFRDTGFSPRLVRIADGNNIHVIVDHDLALDICDALDGNPDDEDGPALLAYTAASQRVINGLASTYNGDHLKAALLNCGGPYARSADVGGAA